MFLGDHEFDNYPWPAVQERVIGRALPVGGMDIGLSHVI